jgi:hypothetical protein
MAVLAVQYRCAVRTLLGQRGQALLLWGVQRGHNGPNHDCVAAPGYAASL